MGLKITSLPYESGDGSGEPAAARRSSEEKAASMVGCVQALVGAGCELGAGGKPAVLGQR